MTFSMQRPVVATTADTWLRTGMAPHTVRDPFARLDRRRAKSSPFRRSHAGCHHGHICRVNRHPRDSQVYDRVIEVTIGHGGLSGKQIRAPSACRCRRCRLLMWRCAVLVRRLRPWIRHLQQRCIAAARRRVHRHSLLEAEASQIIRPARLGPGAGQALAAEWLRPDHGADHAAVDVDIPRRHPSQHARDKALVAALHAQRQPVAGCRHGRARRRARSRPSARGAEPARIPPQPAPPAGPVRTDAVRRKSRRSVPSPRWWTVRAWRSCGRYARRAEPWRRRR